MKHQLILLCIAIALIFVISTEARAETYGFSVFTTNGSEGYIGEQQLSVDVTDPGGDQALFTFHNIGPNPATIHEVYFEDGQLLQIYDDLTTVGVIEGIINDSPDVIFYQPVTPSNVPSASSVTPPFVATAAFSVDSTGGIGDGLDPGEELGILFDLKEDKTFADVIAAIGLGFTDPDITVPRESLRIALHVGGIGEDGDSEGYIMTPIPPSVLIGILGMGFAGIKLRKYA